MQPNDIKIDGWFDFDDIYTKMVNSAQNGSHFVEVGSWLGKSTCFMAKLIQGSKKDIRFDCVDIWEYSDDDPYYKQFSGKIKESLYFDFLKNMVDNNVLQTIKPIKMDSVQASYLYADNSLDFVFIDANHWYEFVKKDNEHWYKKVKPGGFIGGHDYQSCPGVKQAVDEMFGDRITLIGISWFMQKT